MTTENLTVEVDATVVTPVVTAEVKEMQTCDKCGPMVKATVVVTFVEGLLTFCSHCFISYRTQMTTAISVVGLEDGSEPTLVAR